MATTKTDKGASAPETKECANCLAPDGKNSVALKTCTRCKATHYCGRACQTAHWKVSHRQFCLTPEERMPTTIQAEAQPSSICSEQGPDECPICLDPLTSGITCTLPCTHTFHAACVEGLRSFGLNQACPMCRVELPPGRDKLYEEATRRYFEVRRQVILRKGLWGALTNGLQGEMDEVMRIWRLAADQGHAGAQCTLGNMYDFGRGVTQDYREAERWYRKAAEQGHTGAQCNLGVLFIEGLGVKQDFVEAMHWVKKAAEQSLTGAQSNLGSMYREGQGGALSQCNLGHMYAFGHGVKQNDSEAVRWFRKAAEQGLAYAQNDLGKMYFNGRGVERDLDEAARWFRKAAAQGCAGAEERALCAEAELRKQQQAANPAAPKRASSTTCCANCGIAETAGTSVALKPCSRCKAAVYCGKECQSQHWKAARGHKAVCK